MADCERALEVLRGVPIPDFVNEPIRCAAVAPEDEAFFFGNFMEILDGGVRKRIPVSEYRKLTNEHLVPYSHAKHSLYEGRSYMVGALPRLTLNGDRIAGLARAVMQELHLTFPCANIVMNNIAQAVEMVYSVEHALHLIDELLDAGVTPEKPVPYKVHACAGAAATEVPRGTLFYSYEIDSKGLIASADVITPTAQNLSNAEDQLRATVKQGLGAGATDNTIEERLAIVARAYDPCISCSVHMLRV